MLAFGVVSNPISMLLWMKQHKIRFSFNKPAILCKNVVFSSVFNLNIKRKKIGNRRIIIFDSREKLNAINGIKIIEKEGEEYLKNFLLNNKELGPDEPVVINRVNSINDLIEINKEVGLLHKYNTSLYLITAKDLREELKQIILNYVSGEIPISTLDAEMDNLLKVRRGRTKEIIFDIYNIVKSEEFNRIRAAVMSLLKQSGVDRTAVEKASSANSVEAYDVHYLYSILTKNNHKQKRRA